MAERNDPRGETGPIWGASTKRTVAVVVLVLLAIVLYRFREIISPLAIAALLAFVLNPVVSFLANRLRIARGLATALVFVILIAAGIGVMAAPVTAVRWIQRAIRALEFDLTAILAVVGDFFERPFDIGGYALDLSPVYEELSAMLSSFVGSVAEGTLDIVVNIASGALWLVFILIAAFYMVKDAGQLASQLDRLAPPGYRDDFARLREQITGVWSAFLRGQLLLGLAMLVITTVASAAVGLPYPVAMGLLAGIMELIPNLGPIIALVPAVLVAFIRGSNFLPLSNAWFAAVVLVMYLVIQQIEGNFLLPRILGRSLNLHPLVVLTGIVVGSSLAGILGMLFATPVVATSRVVGRYVFYRLYDRDPFADPAETEPPKPRLLARAGKAAVSQLKERLEQGVESSEGADMDEDS